MLGIQRFQLPNLKKEYCENAEENSTHSVLNYENLIFLNLEDTMTVSFTLSTSACLVQENELSLMSQQKTD